jgi:hypothetical protein
LLVAFLLLAVLLDPVVLDPVLVVPVLFVPVLLDPVLLEPEDFALSAGSFAEGAVLLFVAGFLAGSAAVLSVGAWPVVDVEV